jgi:hypothetical protein
MHTHTLATRAQMAKLLQVSPRHLWKMQASGAIPVIRLGKVVRYDVEDTLQRLRASAGGHHE